MLEASLNESNEAAGQPKKPKDSTDKMPPTSHTLMDLVVTMSIYLPRSSFVTLFSLAAVVLNQQTSDPQLIKKAYKLIPRLSTTDKGRAALNERSSELQTLFLTTADKTQPPARRDRLLAIHEVVSHLPTSDLHFIPSILSEVVLGCKESNEKARTAAFALLVELSRRIIDEERNPPGTVIRNSLVSHMADDAPDAPATIEEFFTMVSAGLAGSSPHMVAASVTALSRLFFEYHAQLPQSILSDLVQTIELFLTSNNREIVRSVLGFVKVAVVSLPDELLKPRLPSVVPNLMVWSKEHKGRLRSKVKGILDRLVRRFGGATVEGLVGETDRKFVVSIRKERERKKRKKQEGKAGGQDQEDEDEGEGASSRKHEQKAGGEKSFTNEFDKAVYGSDSDFDSDDSDDASEIEVDASGNTHKHSSSSKGAAHKARRQDKGGAADKRQSQYIRELSPESNPLDLLAPDALASISTTKPSVRFLASKDKRRSARVDEDGKLLLGNSGRNNSNDNDTTMDDANNPESGAGVNAYVTAVGGSDAVRRGQKGRLKVGQGKKTAGAGNEMDIDSGDEKQVGSTVGGGRSGRRGLGMPKASGSGSGSGRIEKRRDFKVGRGGGRRGRGGGGGRGGRGGRMGK